MNKLKVFLMNILLFTILSIMFLSCTPEPPLDPVEIIAPIEPEQSQLIGTWTRNQLAWQFTASGDFTYYDWIIPEIYNHGFYLDDPEQGILYVEDYLSEESMYYLYSVDGIILSMAPDFAPENVTEWERVE